MSNRAKEINEFWFVKCTEGDWFKKDLELKWAYAVRRSVNI